MFVFNTIGQYHSDLLAGRTDCLSAVEHYLLSIEKQQNLNAFVEVYADEARQTAIALDEKRKKGATPGKLHGVVIALKDVICYKDHKVSAASAILNNFNSLYSATAVQYLIDEEAIIIGTCNCDEFAMGSSNENSVYGPVRNAFDPERVPGGSSGGSAVAVQAGMCMLSLGTDTGGSVRQPADFCGIIGLKPGYGSISRYGLIAYASSFDQIGIFAHTLKDAALMLSILSQPDLRDSTMNTSSVLNNIVDKLDYKEKKFRIAYFTEALEHPSLDKEIAGAIKKQLDQCKETGHTVEAISFNLLDYIVPAYYVLTTAEASSNLSRYDGIRFGHQSNVPTKDLTNFYQRNRSEGFGKEVKRRIMLGTFVLSTGYYDAYYNKAQQVRRMLIDHINLIFKEYDAIILPTSPTTAYKLGEKDKDPIAVYLADIFTVFANLTGLPAISIPLFKHSNGMPFGLQIMTNKQDELTLLQLSNLMMQQKDSMKASIS